MIILLLLGGIRNPFGVTGIGIYKGNFRAYVDIVAGSSLYYTVRINFGDKYDKVLGKHSAKKICFNCSNTDGHEYKI